MPEQRGRSTPQDFAFQSTDQSFANPFGGENGAPQLAFTHDRYEAAPATNGPGAPTTPTHPLQQHPVKYQHPAAPQSFAPQHFRGEYGYGLDAPLAWDWGNAVDFSDFANHYEPQGELVQELQTPQPPVADFNIPLPVVNSDAAHHSPPQPIVQNPLSPPPKPPKPPKPPQRPSVQTGMKRKADSEPNSGVLPAANEEKPPSKRPAKSRASSTTSTASPVVTSAVAPESRLPAALTASMTAPAALESTPQTNNEPQKRKEPSKGIGPQGGVIDVSTPRRIVEARGGADVLPSGKVFPIQIGSELFRLSGASISSDGEHHDKSDTPDRLVLTMQERPHTFPISLGSKYIAIKVELVT